MLEGINAAKRQNDIYSSDPFCSTTVHFWAWEGVHALESSGSDLPNSASKTFAALLLKVLYATNRFPYLKHFIRLFRKLEVLGCSMPISIDCLDKFAMTDVSSFERVSFDGIASSLRDREEFFGSVCYQCFMEERSAAFLLAAQSARSAAERQTALGLFASAVEQLEDNDGLRQASFWAQGLFPSGGAGPDRAVAFLFRRGVAHLPLWKLAFAKRFQSLEGDPDWETFSVMADPTGKVPLALHYPRFAAALDVATTAGIRTILPNGFVVAFGDFRHKMLALGVVRAGLEEEPAWLQELIFGVARRNLCALRRVAAACWADSPAEHMALVSRGLRELFDSYRHAAEHLAAEEERRVAPAPRRRRGVSRRQCGAER